MSEKTLVVVKPDGVRRRLVGPIISRFERAGLRITRMEMRSPTRDLIARHYPSDPGWLAEVGAKTIDDYTRRGLDVMAEMGTAQPVEIGAQVKEWLVDFMTSGPVVAMVLEGPGAVGKVRCLVGATLPNEAHPASIRGSFGLDTPGAANSERRPVHNLVHASGDQQGAEREIELWFPPPPGGARAHSHRG